MGNVGSGRDGQGIIPAPELLRCKMTLPPPPPPPQFRV